VSDQAGDGQVRFQVPVDDSRAGDGHVDVIGVDVVTARTLGQDDPRGVVRRDVAVTILRQVLGEVADGHRQVGVPPVQLLELPQDGARIETFLEQKHRLGQSLRAGHHRADVRRFRNVLELRLLNLFAEVHVL